MLCEWAAWDAWQRPTVHGLLSRVEVPVLPYVRDVIGVVFEVWGPPSSEVPLRVSVEPPAGAAPFPAAREFRLPLDAGGMRGVGATLEQLQFTAEGDHVVRITHGDEELARRRFRVVVVPVPGGPTLTA